MQVDRSIAPLVMAALGIALLCCMDAAMKVVLGRYPFGEVIGLRFAAGTVFGLPAYLAAGGRMPGYPEVGRNLLRAVVVLLTAGSLFIAIARLPLAEAVALTYLAPLLLSLLGRLMLKEPIPARTALGIAIGLAGVVVIASSRRIDASRAFDLVGVVAALACAFFYALSNILVRRQSSRDATVAIVTMSNLFALLLASPVMLVRFEMPSGVHWAVFAAIGLLGTAGQLCLAWAYARASAGRLGIVEYTALLWASALGFAIFGETPTPQTMLGAAIIIVACLAPGWSRSVA